MIRNILEASGLTFWPVFAILVFSVFLVSLALWLLRSGGTEFYARMGRMVLDEDIPGGNREPVGDVP